VILLRQLLGQVEAHVEGVEDGTHQIVLEDQPACAIGKV
jgi:hypothetical protein